ncbi:hypothetical protein QFZ57_004316 [Arthrobacter sp. B1I2]|nr:hypothetical protein [Arthrobacter sp. B1I2]
MIHSEFWYPNLMTSRSDDYLRFLNESKAKSRARAFRASARSTWPSTVEFLRHFAPWGSSSNPPEDSGSLKTTSTLCLPATTPGSRDTGSPWALASPGCGRRLGYITPRTTTTLSGWKGCGDRERGKVERLSSPALWRLFMRGFSFALVLTPRMEARLPSHQLQVAAGEKPCRAALPTVCGNKKGVFHPVFIECWGDGLSVLFRFCFCPARPENRDTAGFPIGGLKLCPGISRLHVFGAQAHEKLSAVVSISLLLLRPMP